MDTHQKSFLDELRSLDEPTKTKVLFVSVAVIMVIVVYLWFIYFNSVISSGAQSLTSDQGQVQAMAPLSSGASSEPGFWSRVGNGAAIVGQSIVGGAQSVGRAFESPKNYAIQPGN